MTTISNLYQQLSEGKISKDHFVRRARVEHSNIVSPVNSYDDIVKILKNKGIISESDARRENYKDLNEYDDDPRLSYFTPDEETANKLIDLLPNSLDVELNGNAVDLIGISTRQMPSYLKRMNAFVTREMPDVAQTLIDLNSPEKRKERLSTYMMNESHNATQKLTTAQIIDRLNPYAVKAGINCEIDKKMPTTSEEMEKIREKVAKNLMKNPKYYEADQYANAKLVDKYDSKQEMRPVKKELKDKENQMRKPKGFSPDKANTKASKKENRKGKPKGVKLMKENDGGGGQLPQEIDYTGKDISVSVDPNTKKPLGQPKPGKVVRQHGNILYVDFGDGQETPITISVVDDAQQEPQLSKSELDKQWSDFDERGMGRISAMEEGAKSSSNSDELSRVKGLLDKAEHSQKTAHENRIKILELLVHIEKKLGKDLPVMSYGENVGKYLKSIGYEGEIKTNKTGGVTNRKDIADAVIGSENLGEDLKSSSLKGWSDKQSSNLDKWMNSGKDKKDDKKSDKPEKMSEIVSKLKEYLSKKKSLKKGIKEEDDAGVTRISKNDPKKAEKIKKIKAKGGTYELYDPNSQ